MVKRKENAEQILAAATRLFLEQGYGSTSLEAVAAEAGVTKPTVYSHFGSKQGLLAAITEAFATARANEVSSALESTGNPRQDLRRFGEAFLGRVLSPQAHCWQRLAHTESDEHPEVGNAFFAAGPERVFKALTAYIREEKKAGRLTCPDPELAAEQFLGLLIGMNPIRLMTGQPLPDAARQKRLCKRAVDVFLAAFGGAES